MSAKGKIEVAGQSFKPKRLDQALNASMQGAEVLLPPGEISVSSYLVHNTHAVLRCNAEGLTTKLILMKGSDLSNLELHNVELVGVGEVKLTDCSFFGHVTRAITIQDSENAVLTGIKVDGASTGISLAQVKKARIENSTLTALFCGVSIKSAEVKIKGCSFKGKKASGLHCTGIQSSIEVSDCAFEGLLNGILADQGCSLSGSKLSFKDCTKHAVFCEGDSKVKLLDISAESCPCTEGVISASGNSKLILKNSVLKNSNGLGLLVSLGAHAKLTNVVFEECSHGSLVVESLGAVHAEGSKLVVSKQIRNQNLIKVSETGSLVDLLKCELQGGNYGILANEGASVVAKLTKVNGFVTAAILSNDSGLNLDGVKIDGGAYRADGIRIQNKESVGEVSKLTKVNLAHCDIGLQVFQVKHKELKLAVAEAEVQDLTADPVMLHKYKGMDQNVVEPVMLKEPSLVLNVCAFVENRIGIKVDYARCLIQGCIFVKNKKYSIFLENIDAPETKMEKDFRLEIKWANFVEPIISNYNNVSNVGNALFRHMTTKSFVGGGKFEGVMYTDTLMERIRVAQGYFRSNDSRSADLAQIVMGSVKHVLLLIPHVVERLVFHDLLEDPELGMFGATFILSSTGGKAKQTLFPVSKLFESWKTLSSINHFDRALSAMDEAFDRQQISDDDYDDMFTPLEEMQRKCYMHSQASRRLAYLRDHAKSDPLKTWYFLDREAYVSNRQDSAYVLNETLLQLASNKFSERKVDLVGTKFHGAWVAQWALQKLRGDLVSVGSGKDQLEDVWVYRAKVESLFTRRRPFDVLELIKGKGKLEHKGEKIFEADELKLIEFEALRMKESMGTRLTAEEIRKISGFFRGDGFAGALVSSSSTFSGRGALPGFLRRNMFGTNDIRELMKVCCHIYEHPDYTTRQQRRYAVLAAFSAFFNPDGEQPPKMYKREARGGYKTCEMCLTAKLQPWNELHLESCPDPSHRYCRSCMKESMYSRMQELNGKCPGVTDGKLCGAPATRREMEMAGLLTEQIYNVLESRISDTIAAIPHWRRCTGNGCFGGDIVKNKKKTYFKCLLCDRMNTPDDGGSDPTVQIRLLKGLAKVDARNGEGVFRECYYCASAYEKGAACFSMHCTNCKKSFNMVYGGYSTNHGFGDSVEAQRYVPEKPGILWSLGVFKDKKGKPLKLGAKLGDKDVNEVLRRSKILLKQMS